MCVSKIDMLTRPDGYVNNVFEARGVSGKVDCCAAAKVLRAMATRPTERATGAMEFKEYIIASVGVVAVEVSIKRRK